jgi:hypothetical protein
LRKRERKAVENAAGREGLKLSAWVRKTILEASGHEQLEEKTNGLLAG